MIFQIVKALEEHYAGLHAVTREKLGFVREGRKRNSIRIDDAYHDVLMMGLVREG